MYTLSNNINNAIVYIPSRSLGEYTFYIEQFRNHE
jgi:hypothetical protein